MISRTFSLLFLLIIFYSCDIPGQLVIENQSANTVIFRFQSDADSTLLKTFRLGIDKESKQVVMLLGFGHRWSDDNIQEYVKSIQFVEITTINDTLYIEDKQEMLEFYHKYRTSKKKIHIRIK